MSRTDLDPASPEWLAYERAMHGPGDEEPRPREDDEDDDGSEGDEDAE